MDPVLHQMLEPLNWGHAFLGTDNFVRTYSSPCCHYSWYLVLSFLILRKINETSAGLTSLDKTMWSGSAFCFLIIGGSNFQKHINQISFKSSSSIWKLVNVIHHMYRLLQDCIIQDQYTKSNCIFIFIFYFCSVTVVPILPPLLSPARIPTFNPPLPPGDCAHGSFIRVPWWPFNCIFTC